MTAQISTGPPGNLTARIDLHVRYSTADEDWPTWLRRIVVPAPLGRVLDVGRGTGDIWEHRDHTRSTLGMVVVSDTSPGMVEAAVSATGLPGVVADAARLPFASSSFDTVLAAHMLYHVPDPVSATAEAARIARHDGRFIASTNGSRHMRELDALTGHPPIELSFDLDNGADLLCTVFDSVTVHHRTVELHITNADDADDAAGYLASYRDLTEHDRARIRAAIEEEVARIGFFHVTKEMGCSNARDHLAQGDLYTTRRRRSDSVTCRRGPVA